MPDVAEAVPSPAQEGPATFKIPRSGTPEYARWRMDGTLPEKQDKPKPADPAPADTPKEAKPAAADSGTAQTQEQQKRTPNPETEKRFKHLLSEKTQLVTENAQLRRELEEARRSKETPAESSPAKPAAPQSYPEWRKNFKPTEWKTKFHADNPQATFEEGEAALFDHMQDVREGFRNAERVARELQDRFGQNVSKGREKYPDYDVVVEPVAAKINGLIQNSQTDKTLRNVLFDPDAPHIMYVLGTDEKAAEKFIQAAQSDPAEAIFLWKKIKAGVAEELSKPTGENRNEKGQFVAPQESPAPAKKGPESTPAPPIEIGSRGTGPVDESDRAFQAAQRGDPNAFRAWKKAEDAKDLRRRRGA